MGGVLIPFLYAIITGPLSTYIENQAIQNLLYAPIGWPKLLLYRIFPLGSFPFTNETALLIYIICCNVLFYGLITFCFLVIRSRRSNKTGERPPSPPSFGKTD